MKKYHKKVLRVKPSERKKDNKSLLNNLVAQLDIEVIKKVK
jgi:hypothetical protein